MSWQPPHWSHPPKPSHTWSLLEIKSGSLLATHSLNSFSSRSGCITFGRMDDPSVIDIVTAHESCSRLHARLAFDSMGVLWLKDLGSNNGTFVNNVRLPREACGKTEPLKGGKGDGVKGSRGVMVYPGDILKFGASTRIYCLEGPEEFEREQLKKPSMAGDDNVQITQEEVEQQETIEECTWGMRDEPQEDLETPRVVDPNLPSIESFFSSSKYTIPASLQQVYKTYTTKQYKLQSIQTETGRIVQKEDRGIELTDGQLKQVEKNNERIETLEKELEELRVRLEERVYGVVHGVQVNLKKRSAQSAKKEDEDVDDFYDKTAQREKKQRTNEAESEQSLTLKWKSFYNSHKEQMERVTQAQSKAQHIQRGIDAMDDDEEAFFLRNDLTLANEELNKSNSALKDIEKEWNEVEYLLNIVNPELKWSREDAWIGGHDNMVEQQKNKVNQTIENDSTMMMPPPPKKIAAASEPSDETASFESKSMPPPSSLPPASSMPPPLSHETSAMPPPPISEGKSQTITMPPPASQDNSQSSQAQSSQKPKPNKRPIGPSRPVGTLAALQGYSQKAKSSSNNSQNQKGKNTTEPAFDPRKDEWRAPKDQDGSGRTSLHDKFKGRY